MKCITQGTFIRFASFKCNINVNTETRKKKIALTPTFLGCAMGPVVPRQRCDFGLPSGQRHIWQKTPKKRWMFEFHRSTDCTLPLFQTNLTERPGHNTKYSGKYEGCKCYCFSELFIILLLTAPLNVIVSTVLTLLDY